jgi:peroxiredoxin
MNNCRLSIINKFLTLFIVAYLGVFTQWSCTTHKVNPISTGLWRGEFDTAGVSFPFHFRIDKKNNDSLDFTLINGGETIHADYVHHFGDSIRIKFPIYESVIIAAIKGNNGDTLKGEWIKTVYDKVRKVPFHAVFGNAPLFYGTTNSKENMNGNWPTIFIDSSMAIGVFKQDSSAVSGTFLESTGDERYLSGIVNGDSLYLTGFDGTSADLFKAKIYPNDTLRGMSYYGNGDKLQFISVKNDSLELPELHSKVTDNKLTFTFPDTDGKQISLSDERYKNKIVIIDIMGSWCHNCLDETAYLVDFYNRFHNKGVEIIGLSFERTHDRKKAMDNVKNFMQHFNVPYEILLAGTTQKDSVKKALPQIDQVYGYPTTIILDRKGNIAKTETGFSGPATGEYYDRFKKDFESYIDSLLRSK